MAPPSPRTDASLMPTSPNRAATKAKATPVGMPITQVAEHLGISTHALRIWENRYGWPRPERQPNGYRCYPRSLVALLENFGLETLARLGARRMKPR